MGFKNNLSQHRAPSHTAVVQTSTVQFDGHVTAHLNSCNFNASPLSVANTLEKYVSSNRNWRKTTHILLVHLNVRANYDVNYELIFKAW